MRHARADAVPGGATPLVVAEFTGCVSTRDERGTAQDDEVCE